MGRPLIIKEKHEELLARASDELIKDIEEFKNSMERVVQLCERIRLRALKEGFTEKELDQLAVIVFDKVNLNTYYKQKGFQILHPRIHRTDFSKLTDSLTHPILTDRTLYEGDYTLRISKSKIPQAKNLHVLRVYKDYYEIRVVKGIAVNMRADIEEDWINPEKWEIETAIQKT